MIVRSATTGPVEENCYLVGDEETKRAVIIDPGADPSRLIDMIHDASLTPIAIINTHGHPDHIGAIEALKRHYNIRFWLHEMDIFLLPMLASYNEAMGLGKAEVPHVDAFLHEGESFTCDSLTFEVIHTPGHTPGGVALYLRAQRTLFAGDTLFAGSIGRTDLPGGSHTQLLQSIHTRVMPLPDDVTVYCGHGPKTTIGRERLANPFLLSLA